jgi:hypothetical protein
LPFGYTEAQLVSEAVTESPEEQEYTLPTGEDTGEELSAPSEAGEADSQAEPEAPSPPQPRSYAEIQQAIDSGDVLTTAEREAYRAENNRKAAAQYAREQQRQERETFAKLAEEAPNKAYDTFVEELQTAQKEGRGIAPSLLKERLKGVFNEFTSNAEPIVTRKFDAAARLKIGEVLTEIGGDPQAAFDYLDSQGAGLAETINFAMEVSRRVGENKSASASELANLQAENARLSSEVERLSGARGKAGPGATGKDSKSGETLTFEKLSKMSEAEIAKLDDSVVGDVIERAMASA